MKSQSPGEAGGHAHWLHFALLLALVSAFEAGRRVVASDAPFVLSIFLRGLYIWMPGIAGIAVSIAPPNRSASGRGVAIGLVAACVMIALDLWTATLPPAHGKAAGLFPDASLSAMTSASEAATVSWVRTLVSFARGGLPGAEVVSPVYGIDHPRFHVAEAFAQAGMVIVVFAAIGLVIAAASWMRVHVVFSQRESRRASQVVLGWLVAPLVTQLSNDLAFDLRSSLLFQGGALWKPLVPPSLFLLVGVWAWWYTARYREPGTA